MQKNVFNTFRTDVTDKLADPSRRFDEECSTVVPSLTARTQPFWLRPGFVTNDHCLCAASRQERGGSAETIDDAQISGESLLTLGDNQSSEAQLST